MSAFFPGYRHVLLLTRSVALPPSMSAQECALLEREGRRQLGYDLASVLADGHDDEPRPGHFRHLGFLGGDGDEFLVRFSRHEYRHADHPETEPVQVLFRANVLAREARGVGIQHTHASISDVHMRDEAGNMRIL